MSTIDAVNSINAKPSEKTPLVAKSVSESHSGSSADYIKDIIYGGQDGIVSIFVARAGSSGSVYTVLILAIAKLIAGSLSMAVGDYLSTDAEVALVQTEKHREDWEYDKHRQGEINEMIELYVQKGVPAETARQVITILSKNKKAFIDIMMAEELGIPADQEGDSPWKHALATFFAFIVFGIIPLISYIVIVIIKAVTGHTYLKVAFYVTIGVTLLTMMLMGVFKAAVTGSSFRKSILWTVSLGAICAAVGWFTSWGLEKLTGVSS